MCNHVVLISLNDSNGVTLADENANSIFDADVDVDIDVDHGESVEFDVIV